MSLRARFSSEIAQLGLPQPPSSPLPPVTEADLSSLPESVQRYFRFMGVVGRPRDWSFRLGFSGRFKVKQNAPWRACEVWQYNTSPAITRTFIMRIRFVGLPVIGRDTYRDGHGRMLGKLLDRFTVIDGSGTEFDIGELVTYLNDMILIAPSMLLTPAVGFSPVDASSFDVTLTDHGNTVKARVSLDDRGAPIDFETTDRFCEDPDNPKRTIRARWTTPVSNFQRHEGGRMIFGRAQAVWHLPRGDNPYADFEVIPGSVAFNVPPGQ
jgi:hypothetical protein